MDKLKQCALNFQHLFDIEYKIILGRRNRETTISINFSKDEFKHLMGLHKLSDIANLNKASYKVFDSIISGEITYDLVSKSSFFDKDISKEILHSVKDRIDSFIDIINILDSRNMFFKYSNKKASQISAEFILETLYNNKTTYTFITQRDDSNSNLCNSFFPKDEINYSGGQTSMVLLYKEKFNIRLNEHNIQFIHNGILNKRFIAVRCQKIKKRVTLELRYFNIEVSEKTEEKAKRKLAEKIVEYYIKYLEGEEIDEYLVLWIQRYEASLSRNHKDIIEKIIVI